MPPPKSSVFSYELLLQRKGSTASGRCPLKWTAPTTKIQEAMEAEEAVASGC